MVRPAPSEDAFDVPSSPTAIRQRRAPWRDPRLWLGVVLVLVSVAAGARVFAAADDTVTVWQVARDVPAGSSIDATDVRTTEVHFDDPVVAASYLSGATPVPPGLRAVRDLHVGELLGASAVTSTVGPPVRQLPLGVGPSHQPADLRPGDRVEVWAVPAGSATGSRRGGSTPRLVLRDVSVLAVGDSGFGVSGERQVLVAVGSATDVGGVLDELNGASVVLVRRAD